MSIKETELIDLSLRASDDLLIAAGTLIEASELVDSSDVLSFFEKPWKWRKELESLGQRVVM